MLFWQTRCHFLCLNKLLTNCYPTAGGKALSHLVMLFVILVGSQNLYFLDACRSGATFYKKIPPEWSMDNDTQALFEGYNNKGFPAPAVSALEAAAGRKQKGLRFPGNMSPLCLLSEARE